MLCGTLSALTPRSVTMKMIADANTLTMLAVDEQLYSHEPAFCWSDESGKVNCDWQSFSRDKILSTSYLTNGPFAVAGVMVCDVRCLGAFLAPLKGADHLARYTSTG